REHAWNYIYCIALSSDGKRIATGGGVIDQQLGGIVSAEIQVWDATTGQVAVTLKCDPYSVTRLAFSADSKRLVSAHNSRTSRAALAAPGEFFLRIWDLTTGREMLTLNAAKSISSHLAFSPDGQRLTA